MLLTYWNIGKRIVEQELGGNNRAEYDRDLISALAEDLTKEFGKNYSKRNLHYYIKFYQCFPDEQIVNAYREIIEIFLELDRAGVDAFSRRLGKIIEYVERMTYLCIRRNHISV